jgi:hypothetical protein
MPLRPLVYPTEEISVTVSGNIDSDLLDQLALTTRLGLSLNRLPENKSKLSVLNTYNFIRKTTLTPEDVISVRERLVKALECAAFEIEKVVPAEKIERIDSTPAPGHHTDPDIYTPLE